MDSKNKVRRLKPGLMMMTMTMTMIIIIVIIIIYFIIIIVIVIIIIYYYYYYYTKVYYYYASMPTPTGAAVFLLAESLAVSGATLATPSQATYATLAAQLEPK